MSVRRDERFGAAVSTDARWLAASWSQAVDVWNLAASPAGEPLVLRSGGQPASVAIDPSGSWLAAQSTQTISLWPLTTRHPQVLRGSAKTIHTLVIDPHGSWMAAGGTTPSGSLSVWPLLVRLGLQLQF